jgi:hypothetical protein
MSLEIKNNLNIRESKRKALLDKIPQQNWRRYPKRNIPPKHDLRLKDAIEFTHEEHLKAVLQDNQYRIVNTKDLYKNRRVHARDISPLDRRKERDRKEQMRATAVD